jgi:tetratricopeptide (TPR) repeat protein
MSDPDTQPPLLDKGHPGRADSCERLAGLLWYRFKQNGDVLLLDKTIELAREALCLRPAGHPDRARSCGNLALGLQTHYDQTGDTVLLDEALELQREALRLRPEGNPHRAISCGGLALALRSRFNQTGHTVLLDEALELQREALRLRPEGNPHRAISCGGLANLLQTRFSQTGHIVPLDEALELEREALRLRPEGHPDRAHSCGNLAVSLRTRFNHTGEMGLLDEAIELQKEALHLRPEGHPDRAVSCGNLAEALRTCFDQTGHTVLLDEAIEHQKQALLLRPEGHPDRYRSCGCLALLSRTRFEQTQDCGLLEDARSLCTRAITDSAASPDHHVHLRVELAHIYSLPTYSSCNPSTAIGLLLEAIQYRTAIIPRFYSISYLLRLCAKVAASDEDHVRLLNIYRAVIDVLPEMGSVVLPKLARLHRWQKAGNLPLEALLQAVKADNLHTGLELLEQGRAVLWSETLAIEGTYLQGLPDEWKARMQMLLRSLSAVVEHGDTQHSVLAAPDRAHAVYTHLQQLLKDIRASPGLERFMRGSSYSELMQVASVHPVIILAASDTACHALVLSSASTSPTHLVLNKISSTDIELLGHDIRGMDLNVRALSGLVAADQVRGALVNGKREDPALRKLHQALKRLWADVVKPILDCLAFKVCGMTLDRLIPDGSDNIITEDKWKRSSPFTLVPRRCACVCSNPRCRSVLAKQPGVLLRLRCVLLHPNVVSPTQGTHGSRTKGPAIPDAPGCGRFRHYEVSGLVYPRQRAVRDGSCRSHRASCGSQRDS